MWTTQLMQKKSLKQGQKNKKKCETEKRSSKIVNVNSVTWVTALRANKLNKSKLLWLENKACSMYRRHSLCSETQKVESERMRKIYKQQAQGSWNCSTESFKMDLKLNKVAERKMNIKMRWLIYQKVRITKNTCASKKAQKHCLKCLRENQMIWYWQLLRGKIRTEP